MAAAYRDALAMLVRQKATPATLERLAMLADATGNQDAMRDFLQRLIARRHSSPIMADLLQRRARTLAEEGAHEKALQVYASAKRLGGPPQRSFPRLDSADSLLAVGQTEAALDNWQYVVQNFPKTSLPFLIAQARLETVQGAPDAAARALNVAMRKAEADPSKGELLRRARYAMVESTGR